MRDHTQGQFLIPERLRGPLAQLTSPPPGPITPGNTNKGGYYTPLMKDTRGQRGAGWTPPGQKIIDPTPPPQPPNPPAYLPISPVHHVRASGVRDLRGPAEVGKGRGLNGLLIEREYVAQRGPPRAGATRGGLVEERRMMDLNDHMTGSHVLGNRKQEISTEAGLVRSP